MALSQLHIITATDGSGTNCHDRALAALAICDGARAVIGSLLLRGCRDLRTGRRIPWAKPWGHHIWLMERDGDFYDPSAANLAHWAEVQAMELPKPWQQLTAGVIVCEREQKRILGQIIGGHLSADTLPDAIYLPGVVYSSDVEEMPTSPAYVTAWGCLALKSVKAGGWDAAQLREALERVDGLMAQPPRIKSFTVPIRSAQGFAQGVL